MVNLMKMKRRKKMNKRKINFIKARLKNEPFLTFNQKTWRTFTESELREAVGIEREGERFGWNTILLLMLVTENKYNEDFYREVVQNTKRELKTLSPIDRRYVKYQLKLYGVKI